MHQGYKALIRMVIIPKQFIIKLQSPQRQVTKPNLRYI